MKQFTVYLIKPVWIQRALTFIIIASLLAGCNLPWQPSPEETLEEIEQSKIEVLETATPEPRQNLPPAVVEINPLPNTVIGLNQAITLYFNQPMDKNSVEAAIHFQPGISGRFS